jgi:hypothetical protein
MRFPCVLCGAAHDQAGVAIWLYEGDAQLGDVCPSCAEAGPTGAANRARAYAAALREHADQIDHIAGRLAAVTQWATVEDLRATERLLEQQLLDATASTGWGDDSEG